MEKLFGLEMATIAGALSAMLVLVIASLALLAWRGAFWAVATGLRQRDG